MRLVVVGAGGHARTVLAALRSSTRGLDPVACTDPDTVLHGSAIDGVPVIGDDRELPRLLAEGVAAACLGLGGVGDNGPRARLHGHLAGLGFELPAILHRDSHVAPDVQVGLGSVVLAGAVLGPGASVGEGVIVGNGAIVEHDCAVGNHAHLASGCVLGGEVQVDAEAHVGLGAVVLQGRSVGARAVVGAGAVVVREVPAGETVVGCPADVLRHTDRADGAYANSQS